MTITIRERTLCEVKYFFKVKYFAAELFVARMKGNELNSVKLGIQIDVNSIQRIHFVTFRMRIEIIAFNNCFVQNSIGHCTLYLWSLKIRLLILKQIMKHFIKGPILTLISVQN